MGTADPKLASHMYTSPVYVFSWLPSYGVAVPVGRRLHAPEAEAARARTRKVYSRGILRF